MGPAAGDSTSSLSCKTRSKLSEKRNAQLEKEYQILCTCAIKN